MRINQAKRIFMNESDASPGGGAAPVAPPAPTAEPTAPPTAPSIVEQVSTLIDSKFKAMENALFANARKAGLLKQDKPAESAPASPAAAQPKSDDPMAVLALRDAFDDATAELKLTKGQRSLLREHVMTRRPATGDVESMVSDYVSRAGWSAPAQSVVTPSTAAPQPQVTPQVQPTPAPTSDKGSPAPGTATSWQRELAERPLSMSTAARAAMDAELGQRVAQQKRIDAARALHGTSLRVTPK